VRALDRSQASTAVIAMTSEQQMHSVSDTEKGQLSA
jgi:hypothetical protein